MPIKGYLVLEFFAKKQIQQTLLLIYSCNMVCTGEAKAIN